MVFKAMILNKIRKAMSVGEGSEDACGMSLMAL